MAEQNFKCTMCRPPKKSYKPLRVQNSNEIIIDTFNWSKEHDLQKTHEKDGVSFTDEGIQAGMLIHPAEFQLNFVKINFNPCG